MSKKNNYIKTPLNYTGNKLRIMDQMLPHFPDQKGMMIDLFCGGATVGINSNFDRIVCIDNNDKVINLLNFLAKSNIDSLILKIKSLIKKYNLSFSYENTYSYYKNLIQDNPNNGLKQYNSKGYYSLRDDYNNLNNKESDKANLMLYVLMIYAFNNDIRFNSKGEFNLPVGKTDMNKMNLDKLYQFKNAVDIKNIEFVCSDFRSDYVRDLIKDAKFVYMDPPYLITEAVYNKTSNWNDQNEKDLLFFIDDLLKNNKHFILSNVLEKSLIKNEFLKSWIEKRTKDINIFNIDYHYRGASYNKKNRNSNEKEIIIVSKVVK